jgi:hypothetical protein
MRLASVTPTPALQIVVAMPVLACPAQALAAFIVAAEKPSYLAQLLNQGLLVIVLINCDIRYPLFTVRSS